MYPSHITKLNMTVFCHQQQKGGCLPRPILMWKTEIFPASSCRCCSWKRTRCGCPVPLPPHREATPASPSPTWRGCAPASGLQEDASWPQVLPPSPCALCSPWRRLLSGRSRSGWRPCWVDWWTAKQPALAPSLLWLSLPLAGPGWVAEHPEAWRRPPGSRWRERIRAGGQWTAPGHLLPGPGWAGSCLGGRKRNGKIMDKVSSRRKESGLPCEGQILRAGLIRNHPHALKQICNCFLRRVVERRRGQSRVKKRAFVGSEFQTQLAAVWQLSECFSTRELKQVIAVSFLAGLLTS